MRTADREARNTSVMLCIEVVDDRTKVNPHVSVICSIPGREGALVKRWRTIQGRLNEGQVADLVGWLEVSTMNSLMTWSGVQGVLPME